MNCDSDRYRLLIENLSDAFAYHQVVKDDNGNPVDYIFLEVNTAFEEMTGLKRDNIIGKKVTEVLPGIVKDEFDWIGTYSRVVLNGEPIRFDSFSEQLGRWYDISCYSDAPGCFGVFFHDITERKQTENQLTVFKTAVEQSIDGIALSDMAGYISFVNESWAAAHGYKTNELTGKHLSFFHTPEQLSQVNFFIEKLKSSRSHQGEIRHVSKDGKTFDTWMSATVIHDSDNKPFAMLAVMRDITESKQKEKALLESEAFSRLVMDHLPIGLAVNSVNPEVNFTYMNDNFPKIYHTTRDALFDQDAFWEVVYEDPRFRSEIKQRVLKDCASGDPEKMWWKDIPIMRNGKLVAYINAGNIPIPENDLMISTVWDVTNRVKTEQALRKSEESHRRLFETMAQGVIYQDQEGKIVSANPAAENILGLSLKEMQGKTSTDPHWQMIREDGTPVPGKDHPAMIAVHRGQKVGPVTRGVYHAEKKKHIWLELTAIPLFQAGEEKPFQVYSTFMDITERKQAEEKLEQEKNEKELILSNLMENVAFLDPEMRIIWANSKVIERHNLENVEYKGEKCYEVYHQLKKPCPDCPIIDVFKTGTASDGVHRAPDGRYWNVAGKPVFDEGGKMIGVLDTALDISDLKAIEEELKELNIDLERKVKERTAQLETANRELEAFTHSASHDLRSPLNRISGFSQALLEDCHDQLDPLSQDYLQRIYNSCEHMKILIDDLLKLSRVSQMQISREPVELSVLVNINLKELQSMDSSRQVETVVAPGLVAEGDTALLRIALENLLGNAWKYSAGKAQARIEFGSILQEGKEIFYIRDNGTGFDMKDAEKLFAAFQRLHDAKSYPGTGIGLSIVSRIISRHGGEIWAEGETDKGATFYFTLA